MSAIAFPAVKPTSRSYSPGNFPQTAFKAQNGAQTIVRFGNRRVDSTLQLSFSNISDSQAALILQHYEQVNGDWNYATFGVDNALAGNGFEINIYMGETASGLRWRYSSPPSVESVYPGVSSVSCAFVGVLDGN